MKICPDMPKATFLQIIHSIISTSVTEHSYKRRTYTSCGAKWKLINNWEIYFKSRYIVLLYRLILIYFLPSHLNFNSLSNT